MSDRFVSDTPYGSPDTLRAFLQMTKKLYQHYPSKQIGSTDQYGLQYIGTVENFGSEALIESRKLRMNQLPIAFAKCCNLMQYYFKLQYSEYVQTYSQQNMIDVIPNGDTIMAYPSTVTSPHTYTLQASDLIPIRIVRPHNVSSSTTNRDQWYMTYTNPKLIIDNVEHELFVGDQDNTDHHVVYYFPYGVLNDNGECEIGPNFNQENFNIPLFRFCLKSMETLPSITWSGNDDGTGFPLLNDGVNGQGVYELFPVMERRFPYGSSGRWDDYGFIKVYGDFYPSQTDINYTVSIEKIEYVLFDSDDPYTQDPVYTHEITFESDFTKIILNQLDSDGWVFHTPVNGDYDYDGTTYVNPTYAIIRVNRFWDNAEWSTNDPVTIAGFRMIFDDKKYHASETEVNQFRTGIHLDTTSDYSDHSIPTKFGIIHNLSDFDGLPTYYKYYLDRTIHHTHVELYAIRDDANVQNQHAMDKQTAALIFDSSVPQNDIDEVTSDMEPVIVYDADRTYVTDESKIVSSVNFLSNIAFIDRNHFADHTISTYQNAKRFVYHGNRSFSLGLISFDPNFEYGRGYVISNDGILYDNNATSNTPKPPRTIARICDIPTSFEQLQNIHGISPTLVIDKKYTRQEASYHPDDDERIWDTLQSRWFVLRQISSNQTTFNFVPTYDELMNAFDVSQLTTYNGFTTIPDQTVDLSNILNYMVYPSSPGSGYQIGDIVSIHICGIQLQIEIDSLTTDSTDGIATCHLVNTDIQIPYSNFDGRISLYSTGDGPSDAIIALEFNISYWNQFIPTTTTHVPDIYTYIWDNERNGLMILPFDDDSSTWDISNAIQITGDLEIGDVYYDDENTRELRTTKNVYLRNLFKESHVTNDPMNTTIDFGIQSKSYQPPSITIENIVNGVDMSAIVSDHGLNTWNSFASLIPSTVNTKYYMTRWTFNTPTIVNDVLNGSVIFPKRSDLHVNSYDDSCSMIKWDDVNGRVFPFMYDIMHNTQDTYVYNDSYLKLTNQTPYVLRNFIPLDEIPSDGMPLYQNNTLSYNLYRFDHLKPYHDFQTLYDTLKGYRSEVLYEMIVARFGEDPMLSQTMQYGEYEYVSGRTYPSNVLIVDETTNLLYRSTASFTATTISDDVDHGYLDHIGISTKKSDLINYYMTNAYPDTVYDIAEMKLFLHQNDSMQIPDDQPIGGYIPLIPTTNDQVSVSGVKHHVNPMFIFRLDNVSIDDLDQFRLYDGDVDISEQSMLIIDEKVYTFHNQTWEWNYHES